MVSAIVSARRSLDQEAAYNEAFLKALHMAIRDGTHGFEGQWLPFARQLKAAPSNTFLPLFATAALARSVDASVDPFTLKSSARATEGLKSYSARGVATRHLMRLAHPNEIEFGTSGNEPLNNAPFFGADRVDEIGDRVHANSKSYFEDLIGALTALKRSTPEEAIRALAAILYLCRRSARVESGPAVVHEEVSPSAALSRLVHFIERRSERGARGQAVVAGLLAVVHPTAATGGIHDPSRRLPGDVHFQVPPRTGGLATVVAVEVRQKRVGEAGVLAFARRCANKGVQHAMVVGLHPAQIDLAKTEVALRCLDTHDVAMVLVPSLLELYALVAIQSGMPHHAVLQQAATTIRSALEEVGATAEARAEFVRLWR